MMHRWLIGTGVVLALSAALALIAAGGGSSLAQGDIIYVDADAAPGGNGNSWVTAYTDLQSALDIAVEGKQIWVAEGTYTPTWQFEAGDARSATFEMVDGVALYGGFDPTAGDTEWEDRDWATNVTVLSGNIGTPDAGDNVYHVLRGIEITELAVLDGFIISGGNADGPEYDHDYGGGLFAYAAQLWLENLRFESNTAQEWGGGAYINNSSATLANVIFSGNSADSGGGFCVNSSEAALTNCTFTDNSATYGGAMYNYNASPSLTNCILWGDSSEIYNYDSTPDISFSDIQGDDTYPGTGNINADPLFVDAENGDFHLGPGSPCIDTGTNGAPYLPDYDFEGDPRILDGDGNGAPVVDMGVDEVWGPPPPVIFVDLEATGTNSGTSWTDALTDLQHALTWAQEGVEIWVAAGTYRPTWRFEAGDPRSATFQMVNGAAIYGGFDPSVGDVAWEDRDWAVHETILSGDLNSDDEDGFVNNEENSYHVVYSTGVTETAVLDGFTMTGGYANGPSPHHRGGGMYNSGHSSPTLTNVILHSNSATYGGGMYNSASSPTLTNCTFSGNSATNGGGMHNYNSTPMLTNVTLAGNTATGNGGGMVNQHWEKFGVSATLINCIVWGNTPNQIDNAFAYTGYTTVAYSDVEGGCDTIDGNDCGMGNIAADPLFVDAGAGDLRLQLASPAIDAGNNDAPGLAGVTTDLGGHPRFVDVPSVPETGDGEPPIVDMGAYEAPPPVIYVDAEAGTSRTRDHTAWADAFADLQDALSWAVAGVEIWVAKGTYTPSYRTTSEDPRSVAFQMVNGVAVYGGFDPTVGDIAWEDRDWESNVTILSGDLNGDDGPDFTKNEENSYHVFYHPAGTALDSSAVLDGFTITGGNANGVVFAHKHGGGTYNYGCSPALTNCTFAGNSGSYSGGMFNRGSSPTLTNCTFSGNSSGAEGGGMRNHYSSPALTNCTFAGNSAVADGGGMLNFESSPALANCIFADNSAGDRGGGMYNDFGSSTALTNCTFAGNGAGDSGGGMYNHSVSSTALTNCILWGDAGGEIGGEPATVTYSDVQGSYAGEGNIEADPLFVDPASGDYHLGPGSPCIDAGSNGAPGLPEYDFEGDPRILDGDLDGTPTVDMGVDEAAGYRIHLPVVLRMY